MNFRE
jgi:hypothetical protein